MYTTRSLQRQVDVKVIACDGHDCERFEESDKLGRFPWGWFDLSYTLCERHFCSVGCLERWALRELEAQQGVTEEVADALPDLRPELAGA